MHSTISLIKHLSRLLLHVAPGACAGGERRDDDEGRGLDARGCCYPCFVPAVLHAYRAAAVPGRAQGGKRGHHQHRVRVSFWGMGGRVGKALCWDMILGQPATHLYACTPCVVCEGLLFMAI